MVICTAVCELNPCNVVLKLGYAGAQPELVAALLKAGAEPHAATVSVFSGCPPRGGGLVPPLRAAAPMALASWAERERERSLRHAPASVKRSPCEYPAPLDVENQTPRLAVFERVFVRAVDCSTAGKS